MGLPKNNLLYLMFLIDENNRKISGASCFFVPYLDNADTSPFIYFNRGGATAEVEVKVMILKSHCRLGLFCRQDAFSDCIKINSSISSKYGHTFKKVEPKKVNQKAKIVISFTNAVRMHAFYQGQI